MLFNKKPNIDLEALRAAQAKAVELFEKRIPQAKEKFSWKRIRQYPRLLIRYIKNYAYAPFQIFIYFYYVIFKRGYQIDTTWEVEQDAILTFRSTWQLDGDLNIFIPDPAPFEQDNEDFQHFKKGYQKHCDDLEDAIERLNISTTFWGSIIGSPIFFLINGSFIKDMYDLYQGLIEIGSHNWWFNFGTLIISLILGYFIIPFLRSLIFKMIYWLLTLYMKFRFSAFFK
ncbi:MAG: hypothetical protein JJT94_17295 [Bernardetiaceae bacterium]|nr:hypothetical protein [Bernardetiaceae bacterium]